MRLQFTKLVAAQVHGIDLRMSNASELKAAQLGKDLLLKSHQRLRAGAECFNERTILHAILLVLGLSGILVLAHLWVGESLENLLQLMPGTEEEEGRLHPVENATTSFLRLIAENSTQACHNLNTTNAHFFGLPAPAEGSEITLSTGEIHKFRIVSYDADGSRRCHGGDFFETDLTGPNWKSRPPVTDLGDGSYAVELFADDAFPGIYAFKATLLFSNFHGLEHFTDNWAVETDMLNLQINFIRRTPDADEQHYLPSCRKDDFAATRWKGRWTRTKSNQSCELDEMGRYRCLRDEEPCDLPWCDGPLGKLESNGWVYSAHCEFHLWTAEEAWECLDGKRMLFWGDSNHQDTIRNLLNFVLGLNSGLLERSFNATYADPTNASRSFNITSIFNGHYMMHDNNLGLASLYNAEYRASVERSFGEGGFPDVVVLNSGLHDGTNWNSPEQYVERARNASAFWGELWRSASPKKPQMIFRTTVAPAGESRRMNANPQKMEAYNNIVVEEMRHQIGPLQVIDAYDMSFPWHYDHCCSDGGHYGRPPSKSEWFGRIGHYYFVDIMLVHTLLNAVCQP